MTKTIGTLVVAGALILLPSKALTDDDDDDLFTYEEGATSVAVDAVTPATPAPSEQPPTPPPAQPPAPPTQASTASTLPAGQWVYTNQYGWIWMPYANQYTWVPEDGWGAPWLYVYYPVYGWCWIDAPWVWGIGPWPYFGFYGAVNFSWYGHGWWRQPYRWHYAPPRSAVLGVRSAPSRTWGGHVSPAPLGSRVYGQHAGPMGREARGPVYRAPESRAPAGGGWGGGRAGGGWGGGGRGGGGHFGRR
jgi:uncharacterized membrane protein YgcG